MTNLETSLICVIAFILLAGGFAFYFEHRGALQCKQADALAVDKQEVHEAVKAASDAKTINTEAKTYANAVAAPADPTPALVCVRKYAAPRPLSSAPTPGPLGHAPADVPATDSGSFDPGPRLTPIGQAADARVIELQDYIRRVCLVR